MTPTPHDALFRTAFSRVEHAAGQLRAVLPAKLVDRIDWSSLTVLPGSYVDETLSKSESDLVYSVLLHGQPILIYVLLEHQSSQDPWMPFRVLRYLIRIWEGYLADHPKAKTLPVILPIVFYHGEETWNVATNMKELYELPSELLQSIAPHLPQFSFILDDITTLRDEILEQRMMTAFGQLVVMALRDVRRATDARVLIQEWSKILREVHHAREGKEALRVIIRYILEANAFIEVETLVDAMETEMGPQVREDIMTTARMLKESGRQEGILTGRQEGVLTGRRLVLLKQLKLRFGALSEEALERVNDANEEQLDCWAERILSAGSLQEMLGITTANG